VALAHRDRPLPPLPPSARADVCAFVMRLTAKDPACRLDDAAEVAVWAGLLRDGVSALQAWPDPPTGPPSPAGWPRRRAVLAYACVAVTALVVIVLASIVGFASTPGPVTASPASPRSAQDGGAASPPVRSPAANPGRPPAASLATRREPVSFAQAAAAVNPGHGHGYGRDNGEGHGNRQDNGNGQGKGNGNGQGKGNGKGQGD
jgi:hypothetical protein